MLHAAEFCHFWSFVFCKILELQPLKCVEIYDMDVFFANFMENATVINFENRLTVMNECIVVKFF